MVERVGVIPTMPSGIPLGVLGTTASQLFE